MRMIVFFVLAAILALTVMGALVQAPARRAMLDRVRLAELNGVLTTGGQGRRQRGQTRSACGPSVATLPTAGPAFSTLGSGSGQSLARGLKRMLGCNRASCNRASGRAAPYAGSRRLLRIVHKRVILASVYNSLERLESKGLVTSTIGDPTPERGGRAKRYFSVTSAGLSEVRAAKKALTTLWRGIPVHEG